MGAIASSAVTAVAMKADCLEFGKVVQQLEGVLVKAEDLEDQLGVVDDVRDSLEEALQLMETLQQRGVLSSVLYSKSDKNRFEEIREKIEKAIARLNLAATVEAAAIAKAQFKQSAGLQQKVNELGGWEKVAADPDAKRALEEELSASDRLLAESISENRKTLKAVGQQVTRGLHSVEAMQKETLEKVTAGQDEAAQKLETMTQRFIDMERQSELQRMHNMNLQTQVGELKSMLSNIKGAMSMFPVPAKEPERMEVLGAGGFMSPDTFKDTKVQRALQDLANEASARWSALAMINLIGGSRQLSTACAAPVAGSGQVGGHDVPEAVELQQLPGNMCGLWLPRKATPCQHVVNSEKPLVFSGVGSDPRAPKFATPDELQLAAKVDPDVKLFLDKMAESKFPHYREGESEAVDFVQKFSHSLLVDWMGNPETSFYAGCPVVVEKKTLGSFCIIGKAPPGGWCDADLDQLKLLAQKASLALETDLEQKRRDKAQAQMQAMMAQQMQQMQMMQQQQMQAMMSMMANGSGVLPVMAS